MFALSGVVDLLARLAQPWSTLYNDQTWLQTTITFVHLAAIFLGGGFAIATDRETFVAVRTARLSGQIRHLGHLRTIHKPVEFGLILALVSGFLLFAADIAHFATSAVFWVKMGFLSLLLTNGYLLKRTEAALNRGQPDDPLLWTRLRNISAASMGLWLAVILAGTFLTNSE